LNYTAKEIILTWEDILALIKKILDEIKEAKLATPAEDFEIIAIANGGIIPAAIISYFTGIKPINIFPVINKRVFRCNVPTLNPKKKYLLIDEIYDTGKTIYLVERYLKGIDYLRIFLLKRYDTDSLLGNHLFGRILNDPRWVVFPWEKQTVY
jgi:uncharacterized protein